MNERNQNKSFEAIYNANNLANSFKNSRKPVQWKSSVQNYRINLLRNIRKSQISIQDGSYKPIKMKEFLIRDRGRTRWIRSQHIFDRVIQRNLTDNILFPAIKNKLIYDNGASLKGKGISFSRKRFFIHCQKAYKQYGENACILKGDFSKFFDNILHSKVIEMFLQFNFDERLMNFIKQRIKEFAIDVSYMTDKEYKNCYNNVFNSTEYNFPIEKRTGEKIMYKSMSVGNHISQLCGIYYLHQFDNFFKIVKGIKYYGRYMDDFYVISNSKSYLKKILKEASLLCNSIGLKINLKKTTIHKLITNTMFLKINIHFKNLKLIKIPHKSVWKRQKIRLKHYEKFLKRAVLNIIEIFNCFKSWIGSYKQYQCNKILYKIQNRFFSRFVII